MPCRSDFRGRDEVNAYERFPKVSRRRLLHLVKLYIATAHIGGLQTHAERTRRPYSQTRVETSLRLLGGGMTT